MDALTNLMSRYSPATQGMRHHHASGVKHADCDDDCKRADSAQVPTAANSQFYAVEENASDKRSFELNIKTRDGDTVKINVDAEQVKSYLAATQRDKNGTASAAQYTEKNSLSFSYSVEGSLDDDELKAINNLFSDANKLASTFYSGNVEDAFKHAKALNFDNSAIANFSLSMSENQSYSKTQAYQTIQNQTQDPITLGPVPSNSANPNGSATPATSDAGDKTTADSRASNTDQKINPNALFHKLGKFLLDAAKFLEKHTQGEPDKKQIKELLNQFPADNAVKPSWEKFLTDALKTAA